MEGVQTWPACVHSAKKNNKSVGTGGHPADVASHNDEWLPCGRHADSRDTRVTPARHLDVMGELVFSQILRLGESSSNSVGCICQLACVKKQQPTEMTLTIRNRIEQCILPVIVPLGGAINRNNIMWGGGPNRGWLDQLAQMQLFGQTLRKMCRFPFLGKIPGPRFHPSTLRVTEWRRKKSTFYQSPPRRKYSSSTQHLPRATQSLPKKTRHALFRQKFNWTTNAPDLFLYTHM